MMSCTEQLSPERGRQGGQGGAPLPGTQTARSWAASERSVAAAVSSVAGGDGEECDEEQGSRGHGAKNGTWRK